MSRHGVRLFRSRQLDIREESNLYDAVENGSSLKDGETKVKKVILAAALAATMVLAGCSSVSLDESAKEGTTQTASSATGAAGNGAASALTSDKSVYFAFDSYAVDNKYFPVIDRQVRAMMANPALVARIEGNTDSRGSREYNLALGQKRSEAVKGLMQIRGISSKRLEAVSFGRERPIELGEHEEAWAKNRRADIVISN